MASLYSWPFTTMTCHARSGRARPRPPRPMPATTAQWSSGSSSRPTSTATSTTSGSTRGRPTQACTSVTSGAPLGSSWPAPHSQDHVGLAAGQLRQPGGRYYRHHVCRVVPHPTLAATVTAAERCRLQSTTRRYTHWRAARAAATGIRLLVDAGLPVVELQRYQLLGRYCLLPPVRGRRPHADN